MKPARLKFFFIFLITMTFLGCESDNHYRRLTEDTDWYDNMAWSSDGEQIVYKASHNGSYEVMDLQENTTTNVPIPSVGLDIVINLTWLNSEEIAYLGYSRADPIHTLAVFNLTDSTTKVSWVTQDKLYDLCWLPAVKKLAILSTTTNFQHPPLYGNAIVVYDFDTGDFELIYRTENNYITEIGCSHAENKVAFSMWDRKERVETYRLYVLDLDVRGRVQLLHTSKDSELQGPTWSPNGDWIAVRHYSGSGHRWSQRILLVSTSGSVVHELEDVPWSPRTLSRASWSPVDNTLLIRQKIPTLSLLAEYSLYLYDFTPPSLPSE